VQLGNEKLFQEEDLLLYLHPPLDRMLKFPLQFLVYFLCYPLYISISTRLLPLSVEYILFVSIPYHLHSPVILQSELM
jgi:hypothetical protein